MCKNRTELGNLDVINILRGRGVFPVMPAQAGIQVAALNFSGFLPSRLCRNVIARE